MDIGGTQRRQVGKKKLWEYYQTAAVHLAGDSLPVTGDLLLVSMHDH
jgi:hypothetical protein